MKVYPVRVDEILQRYVSCDPEEMTGFVVSVGNDTIFRLGHRFHVDQSSKSSWWCGDDIAYLEPENAQAEHEVGAEWLRSLNKEFPIRERDFQRLDLPTIN